MKTWFKDRFNFKIDDSEIFFSPGVVAALSYLIQTLTNVACPRSILKESLERIKNVLED